jgi:hypothetical protein
MLAQRQSGLLNVAQLARNLGVDAKTAQIYIDLQHRGNYLCIHLLT